MIVKKYSSSQNILYIHLSGVVYSRDFIKMVIDIESEYNYLDFMNIVLLYNDSKLHLDPIHELYPIVKEITLRIDPFEKIKLALVNRNPDSEVIITLFQLMTEILPKLKSKKFNKEHDAFDWLSKK